MALTKEQEGFTHTYYQTIKARYDLYFTINNHVYDALIVEGKPFVELGVINLKNREIMDTVMLLSARGFESELKSELVQTRNEKGRVICCTISTELKVTKSDRVPEIAPYRFDFPKEHTEVLIPQWYVQKYIMETWKWHGTPNTIEFIMEHALNERNKQFEERHKCDEPETID
jgi:hypothetical protein